MKYFSRIVPLILFTLATPAHAHPGHDIATGFMTGLLHPLTGLDHMLAMLMVGRFAGLAFPTRTWMVPTAFVLFMLLGFTFGAHGGHLAIAPVLIVASLFGLGVALVIERAPPLAIALPVIALFAIGHGFAHGSEMAPHDDAAGFALGFLLTTITLHLAGIALATIALRPQSRRIGQAVGLTGTVAAVAMLCTS